MKRLLTGVLVILMVCITHPVCGGDLNPPGEPSEGSGMPTLAQIYEYLNSGTLAVIPGLFQEPSAGPGVGTMKTTKEIYDVIKDKFEPLRVGETTAEDVLGGKPYFDTEAWGIKEGSMADHGGVTYAPGTDAQTVAKGYHDGTGEVEGDKELSSRNIKSGVSIFGVSGDPDVVDTSSGDAAAGDILSGKKAWVGGSEVTGNVSEGSNVSGGDGAKSFKIPKGLYSGSETATATDTDLVAGNIKSGRTIFGVPGKTEVMDTTVETTEETEPVVAERMRTGDVAFVNASEITGSGTRKLSSASNEVAAGYYEATTLSAEDEDLAAGKIKKDVAIFGVTGTYPLAGVAKTGQTTSDVPYDDGDLGAGVAWPTPRFTETTEVTVTDNLTGLMWAKNANLEGRIWGYALTYCNELDLGGYDDWRLPNIKELQSLIDFGNFSPALPTGHPFTGVQSAIYWSSTTYAYNPGQAWGVHLDEGYVAHDNDKGTAFYVWPVRGGQ